MLYTAAFLVGWSPFRDWVDQELGCHHFEVICIGNLASFVESVTADYTEIYLWSTFYFKILDPQVDLANVLVYKLSELAVLPIVVVDRQTSMQVVNLLWLIFNIENGNGSGLDLSKENITWLLEVLDLLTEFTPKWLKLFIYYNISILGRKDYRLVLLVLALYEVGVDVDLEL